MWSMGPWIFLLRQRPSLNMLCFRVCKGLFLHPRVIPDKQPWGPLSLITFTNLQLAPWILLGSGRGEGVSWLISPETHHWRSPRSKAGKQKAAQDSIPALRTAAPFGSFQRALVVLLFLFDCYVFRIFPESSFSISWRSRKVLGPSFPCYRSRYL